MRLGKFGKLLHWDTTSLGVGNIKRFTIIEIKYLGGIVINIFNTETQDRFHSHAFWAWSWMVRGSYLEEVITDGQVETKTIEKSRVIPRNYIHKITKSTKNAVSVTFEGPWGGSWNEYFDDGRVRTYGWGRKVLFDSKLMQIQKEAVAKSKIVEPVKEVFYATQIMGAPSGHMFMSRNKSDVENKQIYPNPMVEMVKK